MDLHKNYWQGKNIRLRAVEPSDADTFFHWNQDSEMGRALDFLWPPISKALVIAQVEEAAKKKPENDRIQWIIEARDGEAVGSIDTHSCSLRDGTFSYGVNVAVEHQKKGYGSEAVLIVLRYFFEELRYQKVTVPVHSDNPGSIRLHEKLGYQREGTLRRMMFTHGQFTDLHWYGMTNDEFWARYGKTQNG